MTVEAKKPLWIAVVGPKKSGKTSLIEALIPYLKSKDYRVATVKHSSHRHTFDREGSDSHRHAQAGAERVVLRGPGANLFIAYDMPEDEAGRQADEFLSNFDVVICEGFRDADYPKVVIEGGDAKEYRGRVIARVQLTATDREKPVMPSKALRQIEAYIAAEIS